MSTPLSWGLKAKNHVRRRGFDLTIEVEIMEA